MERIKEMERKGAMINSVLEKKLEELEILREAITINNNDPYLHRKIELQVTFAKTLLAAEISSRLMDVGGEQDTEENVKLRCMAKRLTKLEEALKTNLLSGHDNGLLIEPETNDGAVKDETGLVYESKKEVEDEQWPLFQDASSDENREVKENRRVGRKALICFGFIGLVSGMISLVVGYIGGNMKGDHLFPVPT